jgi:hypothetical protein
MKEAYAATQPKDEMQSHHCHGTNDAPAAVENPSTDKSFDAIQAKCRMRSCDKSHSAAKFVISHSSVAANVSDVTTVAARVITAFVANGFSSHTDRGPPVL